MVVMNTLPLTLVVAPAGAATAKWKDPSTRFQVEAGQIGHKTAVVTNTSQAPISITDATFESTDATVQSVLVRSGVDAPVAIAVGETKDVMIAFELRPDAPAAAEVVGRVVLKASSTPSVSF